MNRTSNARSAIQWLAAGVGFAGGVYATYVTATWYRYGHPARSSPQDEDRLLDRFMPIYDVAERHQIRVGAPAAVTLAVAGDSDLFQSPIARAMFKGRELMLGATPDRRPRARGLLAEVQSLGWVVLAESPGREIVVGTATRPWESNVTFRSLRPDEFVAFAEPDYVKIAWTLRADPLGDTESVFRTETRVTTTDATARAKFRRYWSFLSPGIRLIRWTMLWPIKTAAEARTRAAMAGGGVGHDPCIRFSRPTT